MLKVRRINPVENYKIQLRALRRKYLEEFQQNLQVSKKVEQDKRLQFSELEKKRLQEISKFKKQRSSPPLKITRNDEKDQNPEKKIKLFQMTRQELKDYYQDRSYERFKRNWTLKKEQNQRKLEAILKIFHDSKSFITYQNLEDKLDQVTTVNDHRQGKKFLSINEMISSRAHKSDLHLEEKLEKRKEALQDALHGTIGGNMGKEDILRVIKEFQESGFSELQVKGVDSQKEDLEAVLDKICL